MDIRSFFGAGSSKSAPIASSSESDPEDSDAECLEPSPPNFQANGRTIRNGKKTFLGWSTMKIVKELFASFAGKEESHFKEQEEHGSPNPSTTGKRQQKNEGTFTK